LKSARKQSSRRANKNNQQISIITSDSAALNPNSHQAQLQQAQQQPHYNTQVKTYTDHGNGHSVIRTGNYSKVGSRKSVGILDRERKTRSGVEKYQITQPPSITINSLHPPPRLRQHSSPLKFFQERAAAFEMSINSGSRIDFHRALHSVSSVSSSASRSSIMDCNSESDSSLNAFIESMGN
jgi:hypothetical protein